MLIKIASKLLPTSGVPVERDVVFKFMTERGCLENQRHQYKASLVHIETGRI